MDGPKQMTGGGVQLPSVMLMYLGRRGAMVRFAAQAATALACSKDLNGCVVISRQSEGFGAMPGRPDQVVGVDVFSKPLGALTSLPNIARLRQILRAEIERREIETVIDLMPHVWSPWLVHTVHRAGARYTAIAHDATPHSGDLTGYASRWANRSLLRADRVFVLSDATGRALKRIGKIAPERITTLFHPDLAYTNAERRIWDPTKPLRLLFLGRILPYKGLPLFVDAAEQLRKDGMRIEIGVFGEGDLRTCRERLALLNAEVVNRWLSESEVARVLVAYDVVVVSHVEASQSGVVAAALGAGAPAIATPVGALPEQVTDGTTGLVAEATTGLALAKAIKRLWADPLLYRKLLEGISGASQQRSMDAFLSMAVRSALV